MLQRYGVFFWGGEGEVGDKNEQTNLEHSFSNTLKNTVATAKEQSLSQGGQFQAGLFYLTPETASPCTCQGHLQGE